MKIYVIQDKDVVITGEQFCLLGSLLLLLQPFQLLHVNPATFVHGSAKGAWWKEESFDSNDLNYISQFIKIARESIIPTDVYFQYSTHMHDLQIYRM